MSYIPDVRSRYEEPLYKNTKVGQDMLENPELNGYWEGYLNDADKEYRNGYDCCVEQIDNFFNNIENYDDELSAAIYGDDDSEEDGRSLYDAIEYNILLDDEHSITDGDYSTEELASMSMETRLLKTMKEVMLHWLELFRDELVVSMIDNMDDDEYELIKAKKDAELKDTELPFT